MLHDAVHGPALVWDLCYYDWLKCRLERLEAVAMARPGLGEWGGGGGDRRQ